MHKWGHMPSDICKTTSKTRSAGVKRSAVNVQTVRILHASARCSILCQLHIASPAQRCYTLWYNDLFAHPCQLESKAAPRQHQLQPCAWRHVTAAMPYADRVGAQLCLAPGTPGACAALLLLLPSSLRPLRLP